MLKWIVNQLWEVSLNFERECLKYEQKKGLVELIREKSIFFIVMFQEKVLKYQNQMLYYEKLQDILGRNITGLCKAITILNDNIVEIVWRKKVSIMLEPRFIINLVHYISKNTSQEIFCDNINTKTRTFDLMLFFKMVGIIPLSITTERKKLKEITAKILDVFEIETLERNYREDSIAYYLRTLKKLKEGKGISHIHFSTKGIINWIHIGSKTLKRLKMYGNIFPELFWKGLGNMYYMELGI